MPQGTVHRGPEPWGPEALDFATRPDAGANCGSATRAAALAPHPVALQAFYIFIFFVCV
jgi:hypothetical protein